MSISNSYPTQTPSLNLNFATGSDQFLDSRLSYSRSSTGTYLSSEKALSSENLLPYSNDLSQSVWTKRNLTVPVTNITAPDGTSSASSLLETTASATHDFYEEFSAVSGTSYTFTMYAKANGRDTLHVAPQATSTIASVVFDLTAVTSTVVNGSADSHSITAIGSAGWYKLQVTVTATGSGTGFLQTYFKVGGTTSYAGDATKGAYIWGCQVSSTGETVLNETSGSIHREYSQLLKTASADSPRFEYASDGQSVGSGTAKGLLIEAQSTNYIFPSENITGWSAPGNMTVSASAMVAPNGTLTADVLTVSDDTVASGHFAYRSSSAGTSGETVAVSFFAKSAGVNQIYFYDNGVGAASVSIFDLSNGTIGGANASNSKMIDCGNGWYRCVSAYTLTGTGEQLRFYTYNGTSTTYIANGFDGFALWGVQVEQASSESSYIGETVSSTITRASDSCSVATSSFYTGGPVTMVGEVSGSGSGYSAMAELRDTASKAAGKNDYLMVWKSNASDTDASSFKLFAYDNSTSQAAFTISGSGGAVKVAARLDTDNVGACANGGTVAADTSAVIPDSLDTLYIGRGYSGYELGSTIKRLALYNVALSDVELQSLTSS